MACLKYAAWLLWHQNFVWWYACSLSGAAFDGCFRNLEGAAPCQDLDAEEACPLLSCNVVHYVLVTRTHECSGLPSVVLGLVGARGLSPRGN